MGAALLDMDDPMKVLAKSREHLMEPAYYYEKFGLYIPHVIFPTSALDVEGILHLYYGVCDTAIALATCRLDDLLEYLGC